MTITGKWSSFKQIPDMRSSYREMVIIQADSRYAIILKGIFEHINAKIIEFLTEYLKDNLCTFSDLLRRNGEFQLHSEETAKLVNVLGETASLRNDAFFASI